MGMNDDDLSPQEHADMRRRLVSGARGIKPAGAHRTAWIATSVAVVLVAGLAATAIGAANLLGSADPAPVATNSPTPSATGSPTPSQAPTPTPTPTAEEPASLSTGVVPFAGECANALSDSEAATAAGQAMVRSDFRWESGAYTVAGGIDCLWLSTEEYIGATVNVYAYPDSAVPSEVRSVTRTACEQTGDGTRTICDVSGVHNGTWLLVRAVGWTERLSVDGVEQAYEAASRRLSQYDAPRMADPRPEWWSDVSCEDLVSGIDPSAYGYERVAAVDHSSEAPEFAAHPNDIVGAVGEGFSCDLSFSTGSEPERDDYASVSVATVPGGAVTFHTVEAAEFGERVDIEGAVAAMWVPGLDRFEGSWNTLVVSDGVNILMLSGSSKESIEDLALLTTFAEDVLPDLY